MTCEMLFQTLNEKMNTDEVRTDEIFYYLFFGYFIIIYSEIRSNIFNA